MANPQHLELLLRDENGWNKWRKENPSLRPDLSGVPLYGHSFFAINLSNTDLTNASLMGANFNMTDLSGADLTGASLHEARLEWTILDGANLTGANLFSSTFLDADLNRANLSHAYLSSAIFKKTDFQEASFIETKFTGASMHRTIFSGIDLSDAIGLETIQHHGPSTIGLDTLVNSKGQIPDEFLRGCGVPEKWIRHLNSFSKQ